MTKQQGKLGLTARIVIGMVLGFITGLICFYFTPTPVPGVKTEPGFIQTWLTQGLFQIGGQLFIASLKMLVVPLVFVSLVCGTCSLSDPSKLGRLSGKAIGLYLLTTAIAISLAISMALIVKPGVGVDRHVEEGYTPAAPPSLTDVFTNLVPTNPIEAMASGNMLQIIVFAVLFGVAVALSGKAGARIAKLFEDFNEVIMKLVTILMNLAPYGVFFLMAKLFAGSGLETLGNLIKYFLLVLAVLLMHAFISYPLLLKLLTRLNPFMFLRKMRDAALFAFSTASSNATLPVTLETVTKKLGAKNSIASFTVPLGATINMDGTAIMQGVATVFIAQVYGMDLSLTDFLMVVLTATLASVGTAGVPGVGLVMLAMVLTQVNLPVEGIGLIIGVDRLLDMTRTAVNITGDAMVTVAVAKSEGELDEEVFNDPAAARKEEEVHLPHRS
ncbi:dicarboxylate/amino acid:cation symporter [Gallaecimonas xiamenensis]|uniref:Na+/H+-glutamate/aspartate symport protein n=1 Tax=Gallaecimonas xiamenensis 3-C-1 TaxID=745411 RepID=K2IXR0_9GAMM|nr:dicarboxylate/amino acid:cation symporter [Gallaecimonas xiamenensis]EKE75221.1 Na+/H+ - glutamate/aspartate symport protein [Gallaecimonas xiamenensis 3-C-1]